LLDLGGKLGVFRLIEGEFGAFLGFGSSKMADLREGIYTKGEK
jgi:hypothetical protein